ncbi:cell division ATP-binding protein FtsE [Enterococcus sp. DIV0756]|uniref:cell division ATP-binding protein FtsE n=1 Tax=Enterococcus sp. DIV0756 TaxID=2774636 RepID=UPI003F1EEAFC
MIVLNNVSKYMVVSKQKKRMPILRQLRLRIEKGEFVYITGSSGAGKSTLLKLLYKELSPDQGEVIVGRTPLSHLRRKDLPYFRRQIGVVFQDFRLLPTMTVAENLEYVLDATGTPQEVMERRITQVLKLVGLSHRRYATNLSGGEAQRVAIARAVINQPKLVLADEPTGNLDAKNAMQVLRLLERINRRGVTVLVTTHNQALIRRFPHRVITLENGEIITDKDSYTTQ